MSKSAEHAAEELQATLAAISTKDLVDELAKREGVQEHTVAPRAPYDLWISETWDRHADNLNETGPARILVVID
jgi:hypothetical protein